MVDFCLNVPRMRIVRVAAVGAVGVTVQTIIFDTLGVFLHVVEPSTATLIGGEVGILVGFLLNNRYSFGDRPDGSWISRLVRFHLTVAGSIAIQWLFVFIAEHSTPSLVVLHVAYAAGIVIGFAWNYTWFHLWVWRHRPATQDTAR